MFTLNAMNEKTYGHAVYNDSLAEDTRGYNHGMIERIFAIMKIRENRCRPHNRLLRAMWTAVLIELMKSHVLDIFFFNHAWTFSCFHDFTVHTNVIQNAMECYLNEIIA